LIKSENKIFLHYS